MRLNEFTEQPVEEGYYDLNSDLPGMEPIDFSSNPSFKDLITRYTQLVYQGHTSETDPEEDQEHDDIEQYVAKHFGEKGSAHLQKAAEVSYWGRDDGKGSGGHRGDNLGYASMPGGNFRTTKSGKMHGQDVKMMKNKVSDRLGRHPEPELPEAYEPVVRPHGAWRSGIFSPNRGIARRSLTAVNKFLEKPFNSHQKRTDFLLSLVLDQNLKELVGVLAYEHFPFDDLREKPWFMRRLNSLIARAERKLNKGVEEDVTEGNYDDNRTGFAKPQRNDDEHHHLDTPRPLIYGLKINGKIWQKDGNTVTFFTKERALAARNAILAKRPDVEIGLVQRPQD
jgi:hypothetical protein